MLNFEIFEKLQAENAEYIQLDEPFLALNLTDKERNTFTKVYNEINARFPKLKVILANYFDCFGENLEGLGGLCILCLQ